MRAIAASAFGVLIAAASLSALAVAPPIIDCPPAQGSNGDMIGSEHFYVMSYPGSTLADVTLYLQFPASGTYTLSSTARQDTFDGSVIGTATATVTVESDLNLPVVFHFPSSPVVPNSVVTFRQSFVSGPSSIIFFRVLTRSGCPVVETEGSSPPLAGFFRSGVAVTITGTSVPGRKTLTIPAVASIHGANGTFFHSDVNLFKRDPQNGQVSARYYCYAGQNCGSGYANISLDGFAGKTLSDIVVSLFGAPETAGAVTFTYTSYYDMDALTATSRVYTPSLPSPTNGAVVPAFPGTSATGSSIFLGMGNNGGVHTAGFRTNAGVFNPLPYGTTVVFTLYTNAEQVTPAGVLGTYSGTWGPSEARQVNDIFAACGAAAAVTTNAVLVVSSTLPVFPYVTVIDNVTGDSIVLGPTDF
jgi:hypothetical protein